MPLVFDPDRFFYSESLRNETRQRLGYHDDDVVIIAAGKFQAHKRLEWLIDAFQRLAQVKPELQLLLVGGDASAYSAAIRTRIREEGLQERARILDFVDYETLNGLFGASEIGIWPRQPAITIQQAMASGLPVVLPYNDLVGHLLRPGSGLYFHLRDGQESAIIEEALCLGLSEWSMDSAARMKRAEVNAWLSAPAVASDLLTQVEPERQRD